MRLDFNSENLWGEKGTACWPSPLRVGRSLRDMCIGFAVGLPLVGANLSGDQRGASTRRGDTRHAVTAVRVGRQRLSFAAWKREEADLSG